MAIFRLIKRILFSNLKKCSYKVVGLLAPLTIPPLHITFLNYFWHDYARMVDKQYCSCSCWDTVFKGSYESGIASYKHMYFNATANTLKIWAAIVFGVIIFYETVKYIVQLACNRQLRITMFVLFATAVFSHYYSWWVYINYWNDEFYSQWYHQLFFSLTELFSTYLVVKLADSKTPVTHRKAFGIVSIAILHIIAGGWDQFYTNVVKGEGYAHQVVRDLGFMIPDILHVILPLCSMNWKNTSLPCSENSDPSIARDVTYMLGMIAIGLLICYSL